jgi:zinc transport system substrate-binding protein
MKSRNYKEQCGRFFLGRRRKNAKRNPFNYVISFKAILIIILVTSCSRQSDKGLVIAVSIPPQEWFVSRIVKDKARCLTLAGPGQNPHNYEPAPSQIQNLSRARAWILSGTEFEISLRPKIAQLFPSLLIIDGTQGAQLRMIEDHDHSVSEIAIDRHIWLGRDGAVIIGRHIMETLCRIDNANSQFYIDNYQYLISEIDDEFEKLKVDLTPLKDRIVFVYHPSFGYFLDEFDIHQEAVETGGKEPGPRLLNQLAARMIEEKAVALFVQPQFSETAVAVLAEAAAVELVQLDPLAADWMENIRRMGQALKKVIQ